MPGNGEPAKLPQKGREEEETASGQEGEPQEAEGQSDEESEESEQEGEHQGRRTASRGAAARQPTSRLL